MTIQELAKKLESQASAEVKKGWTPKDTHGEETFGLNFTKVRSVAREIKNDPCLADELYASSNHDLKVLATFIDDPESYTQDELEKRSEQLYPSPFAEKFCHQVIARSPHAVHFIDKWTACQDGDFRCYAYHTLSEVAKQKNNLSDDFYARQLERIATSIKEEKETVREAMYNALVSIACRDENLRKKSLEIAEKLGELSLGEGEIIDPAENLSRKVQQRKPVKL